MDPRLRAAVDASVAWYDDWSADSDVLDHAELLTVVCALHPGAAVTDYAGGAELDAMVAAGYATLGPQRVWNRDEPSPSGKTEGS